MSLKYQRGYTAPEILIGTVVASALVAITITGGARALESDRTRQTIGQMNELQQVALQYQLDTHETPTLQILDDNGLLPADMNAPGGYTMASGPVADKPAAWAALPAFGFQIQSVSRKTCLKLARKTYSGYTRVQVNGNPVTSWNAAKGEVELNEAALESACDSQDNTLAYLN